MRAGASGLIVAGLAAVLALGGAGTAAAQGTRVDPAIMEALAAELVASLPAGPRIAIRPIETGETDLPPELADAFDDVLETWLLRLPAQPMQLLARGDLRAVWDEVADFQQADLNRRLAEVGAEVLVIGRMIPVEGGIELSYKAIDTREGGTGRLLASTLPRVHPLDLDRATALQLPAAISAIARRLAPKLSTGSLAAGGLVLHRTGEVNRFGEYVENQLASAVADAVAERRAGAVQAITGAAPAAAPGPAELKLSGTVWDHGETALLKVRVLDGTGRQVAQAGARIVTSSIPAAYLPLTPAGGRVETGLYEAFGRAVIGPDLSDNAARLAARLQARARVVTQAVGGFLPADDRIADIGDAARLLPVLSRGITHAEEWLTERVEDGHAVVRLRARVKRLDGAGAPALEVTAEPPLIAAGEPVELRVTSDRPVHLAVFAWQADDRVIRVFPWGDARSVEIGSGDMTILPGRGDPFTLTSGPMPGSKADLEGFVAVAGPRPLDYDALAGPVGDTMAETMRRARPTAAFLDALAAADLAGAAVRFVPFMVTEPR